MNEKLQLLLRTFRRQLTAAQAIRALAIAAVFAAILWSGSLPEPQGRRMLFLLLMAGAVFWFLSLLKTVRMARQLQAGSVLIASGQLDRAETWLTQTISRFSLSAQPKLMAGQQLASVYFRRGQYQDAVAICRELLRQRLAGVRGLLVSTRLLLADALLMLDRVGEAYEAMLPVYGDSLSLSERMRLLPIQLRYELSAGHAAHAVQNLPERVQIAELLDPQGAALAHALLAEACRRQQMLPHSAFLAARARLYADLTPIAERYPVIKTVLSAEY